MRPSLLFNSFGMYLSSVYTCMLCKTMLVLMFYPKSTSVRRWLVGWFICPLPWDGGMARTAFQVHAMNLIELGWGKSGSLFRTSYECRLPTDSPTTTNKADCHWWVPKSASYDMLGEQLHYFNLVKHLSILRCSVCLQPMHLLHVKKCLSSELKTAFENHRRDLEHTTASSLRINGLRSYKTFVNLVL